MHLLHTHDVYSPAAPKAAAKAPVAGEFRLDVDWLEQDRVVDLMPALMPTDAADLLPGADAPVIRLSGGWTI